MSVHSLLPPSINCCGAQCQGGRLKFAWQAHAQLALQREPDESQMSALGQKQTLHDKSACPLYPQKADIWNRHVSAKANNGHSSVLFDHLIGAQHKTCGNKVADCLGRLKID